MHTSTEVPLQLTLPDVRDSGTEGLNADAPILNAKCGPFEVKVVHGVYLIKQYENN